MADAAFDEARLLAARGVSERALAALDAILAERPEHVGALLLKGSLLLEAREGEDALRLYRRAAELQPRSAEARNGLARCLHALAEDEEALKVALQAQRLLPEADNFAQTASVYLTLVWCYRELRRFQEAVDAAEEGLARMPDAILAQWASLVEEELAAAQQERC